MPKVVFVMLDGVRPDAITPDTTPTLEALCRRGAYTMQARSVMPSVTLPCHTSIFHSVPPSRHGIVTNDWQPMARPLPGLVDVAKEAGLRCGFIHNWEPLRNLNRPESLYFVYYLDNCYSDPLGDHEMARQAVQAIDTHNLDFAFVYFGTVDVAGHRHGWMSEGYFEQLTRVDQAVALLLDGLPDDTTLIIQADHGGHERTHGTDMDDDMLIPWMITGPGIRQNYAIQSAVSLLDTAPTIAHLLGLTPHRDWEGRVVEEVMA
ncbi:MAG: alkaline phosphatase family protein [Caldilineaceae bacterium]|nr:alkaline phosphatase family protein [Caldilineaceae bacterium]